MHIRALLTLCLCPGDPVIAVNNNMSIWAAAVGSSYMCNKEQTLNVTDTLTLYTFELRVQPFEVNKGEFATGR